MSDVLVTVTGIIKPVSPMNGDYYTMPEIQSHVGNYVQKIRIGSKILIVDEEGKSKGKMPNRIATGWLINEGINEFVAGNALLIERTHIH